MTGKRALRQRRRLTSGVQALRGSCGATRGWPRGSGVSAVPTATLCDRSGSSTRASR